MRFCQVWADLGYQLYSFAGYMLCQVTYRFIFYTVPAILPY